MFPKFNLPELSRTHRERGWIMNSRHTMTAGPNLKRPHSKTTLCNCRPFLLWDRKNSPAEKELAFEDIQRVGGYVKHVKLTGTTRLMWSEGLFLIFLGNILSCSGNFDEFWSYLLSHYNNEVQLFSAINYRLISYLKMLSN